MTERILAGRYRLLTKLGQGGMGAVWRAEHLGLKSIVAVKLIDPMHAMNPAFAARFQQEAQSAAALRSPNVVQILDYGIDQDQQGGATPYIAMECLEGESLAQRLARVGRLDPQATYRVISQVGRAVAKAHEAGILHRDLKPDNIFLVTNDDEETAKVLDFGIAKRQQPQGAAGAPGLMTQTGAVMGTPYYMSPEQATGARQIDARADLWSLAVIVYECLVGRRPFDAENMALLVIAICREPPPVPSRFGPVPAGFDEWFLRAVSPQADARFTSVREFMTELRKVCEGSLGGMAPSASYGAPHAPSLPLFTPAPVITPAPSQSDPGITGAHLQPMAASVPGQLAPRRSGLGIAVAAVLAIAGVAAGTFIVQKSRPDAIDSAVPVTGTSAPLPVPTPATPVVTPIPTALPTPAVPASSVVAVAPRPSASVAEPTRPVAHGRPRPAATVTATPVVKPVEPQPKPTVATTATAAPRPATPAPSSRLESELGI